MPRRTPRTRTSVVIGAHGFLGRALTQALVARGDRVIAVGRRRGPKILGATNLYGDITQTVFARRITKNADAIYYLAAAKKNIAFHTKNAYDYYEGNVRPLIGFLNAVRSLPPKTIVYSSSILVGYATHEAAADGYLLGKQACEHALQAFAAQYDWRVRIFRIAALYGPSAARTNTQTANLIPSLIEKARTNDRELLVWGTGKRRLQFIHVNDAVANLLAAPRARQPLTLIGNPEVATVRDIARMILGHLKKPLRIRFDRSKPDKPTRLFTFQNLVRPTIRLKEGIRHLLSQARS